MAGSIDVGEQVPTIREFSDNTGLTYNAVNRAFSVLQAEGLLISRKRAGTFVAKAPASRNVSNKAMHIFALIGPELSLGFYALLQKGFDLAAGERGYQVITSNTDNDYRVQADTILQLMDKSIAGVAMVPGTYGPSADYHIRQLQRQGIPVVLLHRTIPGVSTPAITIPAMEVGRLAGRKLAEYGHRRVAYCAAQKLGVGEVYAQGFREGITQGGREPDDILEDYGDCILLGNDQYVEYETHLAQWFDRHMTGPDRPTALFTSIEAIGEIAYFQAIRCGLRVPEDLSIVTVGGRERRGALIRRLACVTLDERKAGNLAATLLDQMHQRLIDIDDQQDSKIEIGFDPSESIQPI